LPKKLQEGKNQQVQKKKRRLEESKSRDKPGVQTKRKGRLYYRRGERR
jgi:hypothetical protein